MLVSSPGKARTATIRQIAKDMGYNIITIVASRMDAQDIWAFQLRELLNALTKRVNW